MNVTGYLDTMNSLLPSASSTNSTEQIADVISEDAEFQAALDSAVNKINKNKDIKVMTDEEIQQRDKDIREASTELEAILIKMMYNEMYKTVPKDELFGDDNAMDIYRDMYHDELSKVMANAGGIGLADFIYKQMSKSNH